MQDDVGTVQGRMVHSRARHRLDESAPSCGWGRWLWTHIVRPLPHRAKHRSQPSSRAERRRRLACVQLPALIMTAKSCNISHQQESYHSFGERRSWPERAQKEPLTDQSTFANDSLREISDNHCKRISVKTSSGYVVTVTSLPMYQPNKRCYPIEQTWHGGSSANYKLRDIRDSGCRDRLRPPTLISYLV